jgi:hypothetical protein
MRGVLVVNLQAWALDWGISLDALADLRRRVTAESPPNYVPDNVTSEAGVSQLVALEASQKGLRLWRNNVGGLYDEAGNFVRFGLANESAQTNKIWKSGDRIGIRPKLITMADVGSTLGQFVSREIKKPGWKYTGTERELAQTRWCTFVNAMGGDAQFCNGTGSL